MSSTMMTNRPYRTKKLSSFLKNYHLGKFKRDWEVLKLNKITTELPLECLLQDEIVTELNSEVDDENVLLATNNIKMLKRKPNVPKEIRLKGTFHLPVKCMSRRSAYCSNKN